MRFTVLWIVTTVASLTDSLGRAVRKPSNKKKRHPIRKKVKHRCLVKRLYWLNSVPWNIVTKTSGRNSYVVFGLSGKHTEKFMNRWENDLTWYYSNSPVTEYQSDFQKARTVTVIKQQTFHSMDICEDKSYHQLDTPIKIENIPV